VRATHALLRAGTLHTPSHAWARLAAAVVAAVVVAAEQHHSLDCFQCCTSFVVCKRPAKSIGTLTLCVSVCTCAHVCDCMWMCLCGCLLTASVSGEYWGSDILCVCACSCVRCCTYLLLEKGEHMHLCTVHPCSVCTCTLPAHLRQLLAPVRVY